MSALLFLLALWAAAQALYFELIRDRAERFVLEEASAQTLSLKMVMRESRRFSRYNQSGCAPMTGLRCKELVR